MRKFNYVTNTTIAGAPWGCTFWSKATGMCQTAAKFKLTGESHYGCPRNVCELHVPALLKVGDVVEAVDSIATFGIIVGPTFEEAMPLLAAKQAEDRSARAKACHPDVMCPTCNIKLVPEHAHSVCPKCFYRDSCCF